MHADLRAIVAETAALLRPEQRLTVPEAASRYRFVGGDDEAWSDELTPYIAEPAECLTAREYRAVAFVGPARTGKTFGLIDCWIGHGIVCDPDDFMAVFPAAATAEYHSETRISRMIRKSPALAAELAPTRYADAIVKKRFRAGMVVSFMSPTKTTLASKDLRKVALSDYDRYSDDIGGEGQAFGLALKRGQTFHSRAMCLVESSPGRSVIDPAWKPSADAPHEAAPSTGILAIYNDGDRRRLYGQCPHCREWFLPASDESAMIFPEDEPSLVRRAKGVSIVCTLCGAAIGTEHEHRFKASCRWVAEGQRVTSDGRVIGERARKSGIASFWMSGWFAAFQRWESIALNYLQALAAYEASGDEGALKTTANVDRGEPYLERSRIDAGLSVEQLAERAESALGRGVVPASARYLVGAIDVQGGRFVVQMEAFGVGAESWIVDRFDLSVSERRDEDGRRVAMSPATHPEDWHAIEREVIRREWALEGSTTVRVRAARVVCDMHGSDGVSANAFEFWRHCRANGLGRTFMLLRGDRHADDEVRETVPDQQGLDGRKHKGDVPVLQLNTNRLKDRVDAALKRADDGPKRVHFPEWLERAWFEEALAEAKDTKGRWIKRRSGARNESLDLLAYARAAAISLGADRVDWQSAPAWAATWDQNINAVGNRPAESREQRISDATSIFGATSSGDSWLS